MFQLCTECRKAFDIGEDDLEKLQEPLGEKDPPGEGGGETTCSVALDEQAVGESDVDSDLRVAREERVVREGRTDSELAGDPAATGTSGLDAGPASKRARLETGSGSGSPRPSAITCSVCLGLLNESFIHDLSEAISQELARANYESLRTFRLAVSTPLSLILRRCGAVFYLSEKCEISEEPKPQEAFVKESLRHKLYAQLNTKLAPLASSVESPFQVIVKLDHSSSASECRLATETWPDAFRVGRRQRRKWWGKQKGEGSSNEADLAHINNVSLNRALSTATANDFEKGDFFSAAEPCTYSIEFNHSSIFVGGRYCKYSRDLSQTPWLIGGVRKSESSVQELICGPIQRVSRSSEVRFSSSGREDCDVRMLGSGRPFLVEILNPKRTVLERTDIAALETEINSSTELIAAKRLQSLSKVDTGALKEGEEEKKKQYSAVIWAPEKLTQEDMARLGEKSEIVIHQKTPIRVLHRRTLATRDRTIHTIEGNLVDDHHFRLLLTTQAGTYVKEFVHGDFGRTRPNLRSVMGQDVDILTLDVCEVLLEWPPQ